MSQFEQFSGKIKLVTEGKKATKNFISNYCIINEISIDEDFTDSIEWICWQRPFVYVNKNLYEVIQKQKLEFTSEEDLFSVSQSDAGEYDFEVRYYNGSCDFAEALETGLNTLLK